MKRKNFTGLVPTFFCQILTPPLYMDFVADGKDQPWPWEKLKNQIFLGSDEFVTSLQRTLDSDASYQEIPAIQRRPRRDG